MRSEPNLIITGILALFTYTYTLCRISTSTQFHPHLFPVYLLVIYFGVFINRYIKNSTEYWNDIYKLETNQGIWRKEGRFNAAR